MATTPAESVQCFGRRLAFYQKYVDEQSKKEIKDILVLYDRTLNCLLLIQGAASQRSSEVVVLVPGSRSPTVNRSTVLLYIPKVLV
nr:unnamed protein product [Ipomoea trifida]